LRPTRIASKEESRCAHRWGGFGGRLAMHDSSETGLVSLLTAPSSRALAPRERSSPRKWTRLLASRKNPARGGSSISRSIASYQNAPSHFDGPFRCGFRRRLLDRAYDTGSLRVGGGRGWHPAYCHESGFGRIPLARRAKAFAANEEGQTHQPKLLEKYLSYGT